MNIPDRLDKLRKALTLSWGELCQHLDIKRSMLHYLRNGERGPSAKLLRRIEQAEQAAGIFHRVESGPENFPLSGKPAQKSSMERDLAGHGSVTMEKMLEVVEQIEQRTRALNRDVSNLRAMVEKMKQEQEEGGGE